MAADTAQHLTERQRRNNDYLAWVAAMVAEIPETAHEWPSLPGGERAGFAAEWANYMGMVGGLIGAYWEGALTGDQRDRLFALVRQIHDHAPLLDQMALHAPDMQGLDVLLWPETAAKNRAVG